MLLIGVRDAVQQRGRLEDTDALGIGMERKLGQGVCDCCHPDRSTCRSVAEVQTRL